MKIREFAPNQKYAKSYKTEAAMLKAIEDNGFENFRFVRYTFDDGRITPVFLLDKYSERRCEALDVAHRGFAVVA